MRPPSKLHAIDQILNEIAGKRQLTREEALGCLGIDQSVASRIRNDKTEPSPRVILLIHLRTHRPVLDIYKMFFMVAP